MPTHAEDSESGPNKYHELLQKEKLLDKEIEAYKSENIQKLKIDLLHRYNDIKDAAQIVLGAIANVEGVTVKELHDQFELPLND